MIVTGIGGEPVPAVETASVTAIDEPLPARASHAHVDQNDLDLPTFLRRRVATA